MTKNFLKSTSFIAILFLYMILFCQSILSAQNAEIVREGMNGETVLLLQQNLKKIGYFPQEPTGFYGSITRDAVFRFQKENKLAADGVAGPATLSALDAAVKKHVPVKLVIDPGHGGIDSGADKQNVLEKNINLAIAKRLKSYFSAKNYTVIMTREQDTLLNRQSTKKGTLQEQDLDARTTIMNRSGTDLFISIHANSSSFPSQNGSIVYYNPKIEGAYALANSVQKELNRVTLNGVKRTAQRCEPADFYILRNTNIPGILVETGFLTNKAEREQLVKSSFQDQIAKAVLTGLENYLRAAN